MLQSSKPLLAQDEGDDILEDSSESSSKVVDDSVSKSEDQSKDQTAKSDEVEETEDLSTQTADKSSDEAQEIKEAKADEASSSSTGDQLDKDLKKDELSKDETLKELEALEFSDSLDAQEVNKEATASDSADKNKATTPTPDGIGDLGLDDEGAKAQVSEQKVNTLEEMDDLQSLKEDLGEDPIAQEIFEDNEKKSELPFVPATKFNQAQAIKDKTNKEEKNKGVLTLKASEDGKSDDEEANESVDVSKIITEEEVEKQNAQKGPVIFDVGAEEKKLLEISKYVENKIPDKEWNEIASHGKLDKYVVQDGDWLWKISKTLFGSGFYYAKVWSLNPHILNPHEIEPGMVLVFDTGSSDSMPEVKLGTFEDNSSNKGRKFTMDGVTMDLTEFGDKAEPPWIKERKNLIDQGIYFQYASEETYEDLAAVGQKSLNREYEKYEPPVSNIIIKEPNEQYDSTGLDKDSKIVFDFKEGFFLNTFITTNIVQDFGEIEAMPKESIFVQKFDKIYVHLDSSVKAKPGDLFSVYTAEGKVSHPSSERVGHRYTIVAQIKTLKKINNVWECSVIELSGLVQRGDRLTVYTPKINRISRTFNKRNIEASVMESYRETANGLSFGDVIYLDRGRSDGVELGNIFEVYSFLDKGTGKKITPDPTYKIGELTVITLTDDFATALVSQSSSEIALGSLALSKTAEQAARASRVRSKDVLGHVRGLEGQALEELDVELNLGDLNEDLLKKADQVRITEDELEELERQEREKSVIKEHEKDLKELEKLENEIADAEAILNEAKVDEDKYLEQQNLDDVEGQVKSPDKNSFESVNDIEKEIGLKYLDEDLNSRENPYGLTEFDLEEIDELLNTEVK